MIATDPRHGTEAGFEQHFRDGEEACAACHKADIIAGRRRSKRRTMGHQFTRPVGEQLHARLTELRDMGARVDDIATWAGITDSQVCRVLANGPEGKVYARTWVALATMKPGHIFTPVGAQRRLQALAWLGWSPTAISAQCGMHPDTLVNIRDGGVKSTAATRVKIAAAFDVLSMRHPVGVTVVERRAIGLVRSIARRKGWPSPLSWDEDTIDDPAARPHGVRVATKRTDLDPVVVDRILAGDASLTATRAERLEVIRRWPDSINSLERLRPDWNVARDLRDMRADGLGGAA